MRWSPAQRYAHIHMHDSMHFQLTTSPQDTIHEFPHITANPRLIPASADPFTITTQTGFMPLQSPQVVLPPAFKALTLLCEEMPVVKLDGTPGLLATYRLGPTVDEVKPLPDLTDEIDNVLAADGKPDLVAITAIFRDYSFLASAYLLEPCWERRGKGLEGLGLGRPILPKCIAGPLYKTAKLIDIPPFMSYAASYALFNWQFEDPSVGFSEYSNIRMIRAFEKGMDPLSSEVRTHRTPL